MTKYDESVTNSAADDKIATLSMVESNGGCYSDNQMTPKSGNKAENVDVFSIPLMNGEIEAAASFLADIVKTSRFTEKSTENFKQALTTLLKQHYEGHWYPNDPFKGSGYRCLRVNGVMNSLLTKAAQQSGLPLNKFRHAFPVEFTVWVDPGDVSVRYGEDGSIGCVFPTSGKGLKHDHQQMEDLKKLVAQQQKPQPQLQQRACSTPPPAPVCEKVQLTMNHRGSPPNFVPGSSPPSSFMFSPYDGKCMKVPNLMNAPNASYSTPMPRNEQSSPSRKYQAVMSGQFLDRRTPPLYNSNISSSSLYQQQSNPMGFYGGADLVNAKNSLSSATNQNRGMSMMMDCDTMSSVLTRRTPPYRTMTPTNQNVSPMYHQLDSSPSSFDWMNSVLNHNTINQHNNTNNNSVGDFQFYTNTHFGSAYVPPSSLATNQNASSPARSRLVEPLGLAS